MRDSFKNVLSVSLAVCALFVCPRLTFAQQPAASAACNQATPEPVVDVALPGHPFMAVATPDGCWIFVSMRQDRGTAQSGVAVVQRMRGQATLARVIPLGNGSGMVFSRDGKMLIVTNDDYVDFLDVERLKSGQGDPKLGRIYGGAGANETNVNVSPDGSLLFVSDHAIPKETTTVYRLDKAREAGFKGDFKVGTIHAGREVLGIVLSQDQRYAYIVSEQAGSDSTWSAACPQNPPIKKPVEGILNVVDIERARTDPGNSIVARIKAGCVATRLAVSRNGERVYVTARADDALVVLDATKFLTDPDHAKIGTIPVGYAPTGVALMDGGKKIVVTNIGIPERQFMANASGNRTTPPPPPPASWLTVIDAAKVTQGAASVLGNIPVGAGPRDASITPDGKTIFVPNSDSSTLRLIDIARLRMDPVK